jgi:hypothetical protein
MLPTSSCPTPLVRAWRKQVQATACPLRQHVCVCACVSSWCLLPMLEQHVLGRLSLPGAAATNPTPSGFWCGFLLASTLHPGRTCFLPYSTVLTAWPHSVRGWL